MKLKVLFHEHCFDGVASASLFARFYAAKIDAKVEVAYAGKAHRRGPVFDDADFDADDHAVVDFRYSSDPRLGWWFDHHASAFQLPGDEQSFATRPGDHFFFDATARSCTGLVARSLERVYDFDARRYHELVHWAEIIDGAKFHSADEATSLAQPALQLAAFVEHNRDDTLTQRFIERLTRDPFAELARDPEIVRVVEEVAAQQLRGEALVRDRMHIEHGVGLIDVAHPPEEGGAYNKFSPYKIAPDVSYVVAVLISDGIARVSVGLNPWHAPTRTHHLARLCERYGGGGHPYVGGVTLSAATPEVLSEARRIANDMVHELAQEP